MASAAASDRPSGWRSGRDVWRAAFAVGLAALLGWAASAWAADADKSPAAAGGTTPANAAPANSVPANSGPADAAKGKSAAAKRAAKPDADKEEAAEFRAARPEIQRQMRSKTVATRIEGIRRLQGFPQVDAAKLALGSMTDQLPEVRLAAYETLLQFSSSEVVCRYFLEQLNRQTRKGELNERAVPMLAAVLSSPVPDIDLGARELLDNVLDKGKQGELLVTELADQLGARNADDSVALLVKLSKTQMFAHHFGVRRAVVSALIQQDRLSAVGELIKFLADVKGEARADIVKYLASITGEHLMGDAKAWATWWRQHQETFVLPPPGARGVVAIAKDETPSYYGLPIYAEKMVFVIDTSGSMTGLRLNAAKRELCEAIGNLRDGTEFAIVAFNGTVGVWQKHLMPANEGTKKMAIAFVQSLVAESSTASYDALETAFLFDAEAIFFLSDGEPTSGKFVAPADIVNAIYKDYHSRRESIYTIGIAPGLPDGPMEWFLKTLASQNLGLYRRVDE